MNVQVNKWWRLGLTFLTGAFAALIAMPGDYWTNLLGIKGAAIAILVISGIKGIIDGIAPSAGTPSPPVPGATSVSFITHSAP